MSGPRLIEFPPYAKRYDQVSSTLAYLGDAPAASSESAAVWRISKLVFSADGDAAIAWWDYGSSIRWNPS